MALQSEAIESRLEGLKIEDRRMLFDSKLRAIRADDKVTDPAQNRASRTVRRQGTVDPMDQVVALIDELSRRLDGLERKERAMAEELRRRAREDRQRRSIYLACGLVASILTASGWVLFG